MKLQFEEGGFHLKRMIYWINTIKQLRGKKLRQIHSSELFLKRGLIFLKSQIHPKRKKERFLQFILTWITINSSNSQIHLLWRSQRKAQSPRVTQDLGLFAAGA